MGCCHCCGGTPALRNYGAYGSRGAWEFDHSVPLARGGTNRLSNLLPAHVSCNRSKQAGSTRTARASWGRSRKPMSQDQRSRAKTRSAVAGAFLGALGGKILGGDKAVGPGALVGLAIGTASDPEAE